MLSMWINHVVDVQYPLQCVCDKQKQTCSVISFWYRCHTIRVWSFLWGQPRRKACDGAVDEASCRRTFRLYAWYCPASFLSFCGCCCICPKVKGIHWILRQTSKQFVRCNQPVALGSVSNKELESNGDCAIAITVQSRWNRNCATWPMTLKQRNDSWSA